MIIFAVGLLGGGIYGIAKYHGEAWLSISSGYQTVTNRLAVYYAEQKNKIEECISQIKIDEQKRIEEASKTISHALNEASMPPEITKPPTPIAQSVTPSRISNEQSVFSIGEQVVAMVNNIRAKRGSAELSWDNTLYQYSLKHSQNMATQKRLFHSDMYEDYAENAWGGEGSKSWGAETIVNSWMNSPKHRTWLLCPNLKHVAVGIAYSDNGMYASWTFWRDETVDSDWWYQYTPGNPPKWWY